MGRSGIGVGGAQRVAALAVLAIALLATWQLVLPAIHAVHHQPAPRSPAGASPPAQTPIKGVRGVNVAVLNITGTTGAAGAAAAGLEARGVHVSYVGDGVFTSAPTEVLYRPGAKRPARALAEALHLPAPKRAQASLAPSIGAARIVLLVGAGGVRG